MTIYLFSLQPEGYKELTLPEGESFAERDCLRWAGESKAANWQAFELVWLEDELSGAQDRDADFIKFSGISVMSERAYQILAEPLHNMVEFLPVTVDQQTRYLLNVTNVLDIMDKARSVYKIYSDGKVGMCEHAYLNEPDKTDTIFQVAGFLGRIFVNETFVELIENNGLTGTVIREYKNPQ